MQVLCGTAVKQPEIWYNYAVPGVPYTMRQLSGNAVINTAELVTEEVAAQTREGPISCYQLLDASNCGSSGSSGAIIQPQLP